MDLGVEVATLSLSGMRPGLWPFQFFANCEPYGPQQNIAALICQGGFFLYDYLPNI